MEEDERAEFSTCSAASARAWRLCPPRALNSRWSGSRSLDGDRPRALSGRLGDCERGDMGLGDVGLGDAALGDCGLLLAASAAAFLSYNRPRALSNCRGVESLSLANSCRSRALLGVRGLLLRALRRASASPISSPEIRVQQQRDTNCTSCGGAIFSDRSSSILAKLRPLAASCPSFFMVSSLNRCSRARAACSRSAWRRRRVD